MIFFQTSYILYNRRVIAMGFKPLPTILLFIIFASCQRILVSGRLRGEHEGSRECDDIQTFRKRDESFINMLQEYTGKLHRYKMGCGGNRTIHTTRGAGGYLSKEINGRLEYEDEPERCTFRIQAPEDHQVHIFMFSYKFLPSDYRCLNDNKKAILADWIKFYDGKVEENSLLYSSLHNPTGFKVTSTGRDLLIDIDLSGRNVLAVDTLYQKFEFAYAFIKKDKETMTLYGETKP